MRILVLSYETPAYPAAGGPSRQHSLLEPLAGRHEIRVLSTGGRPRVGQTPDGVDVRLVDPGPPPGAPAGPWLRKNLGHYLGGEPWLYALASHHRSALAAVLASEHAAFDPDLVVVEHAELAPLLADVPAGTPTVLVLHNVLVSVQRQLVANERTAWTRLKAAAEIGLVSLQHRRDVGRATTTITVTEADARLVRRLRRAAHVAVVPNCVNADYFARRGPRSERPTVAMTASYHYEPNQRAAVEVLDEILPRVRTTVPDAELVLVGQQIPEWLATKVAATPGARALADVPDVRPVLEQAWVALAPLRHGSGSPLKVLEALAAEVPVVATPRVADALTLGAGDGLLAREPAAALADAIVELLADPRRRDAMGAAGRAVVRRRFDRTVVADQLDTVWHEAVATRHHRRG